ncbi:MAG: D-glycero-beta-D-manno-heptose-7-phosphate kinase [Gemmatimonadota bacterium]
MTTSLASVSRARLSELLDALRGLQVVVVGDVMLDRYLTGDADRVSPEAPVPVVTVEEERDVPGGAANVAANIAALGGVAILLGVIGVDNEATALAEELRALGIRTDGLIAVSGRPTTCKTRIVARGQQVVRIDREVTNPLADSHREALLAAAAVAMADADALILEDYDKGTIDSELAKALIAAARARGIPVVVDPKQRNFFAYAGATVFKPNRRELESAFAAHFSGEDRDLETARTRLDVENLLLTLGADGMALVSPDAPLKRTPSIAREVFDVSGAGDTVSAMMAAALGAGATIDEAAWIANLAAGVEVGKRGTATVSRDELLAAWDHELGD